MEDIQVNLVLKANEDLCMPPNIKSIDNVYKSPINNILALWDLNSKPYIYAITNLPTESTLLVD